MKFLVKSQQIFQTAALVFAMALCARAEITLSPLISNHMVIQRNLPVHIWGMAAEGEKVSVTFRGETHAATPDQFGRWSVYLPPEEAGGPFELTVAGNNTIKLSDVLVGDVWVASGQSNMEFPVHAASNGPAATAAATACPQIRLFTMEHKVSDYPLESASAEPWAPCNPSSVANFSAVAYFFGDQLHQKFGVPIGLIETNWGGTPADAWTSLEALSADSSLMPVFSSWAQMMKDHASTLLALKKEREEWERAAAKAKAEGRNPPDRQWHQNLEGSWTPAGLFNAMIAPLTPYPIRGVIWYQGESNTGPDRAPLYARLFQTMIRDWRRAWGEV
jgi:sialate O-acetylesterase